MAGSNGGSVTPLDRIYPKMRRILLVHGHDSERNLGKRCPALLILSIFHINRAFDMVGSLASRPVYRPWFPVKGKAEIFRIFTEIVSAVTIFPLILYGLTFYVVPHLLPRLGLVFLGNRELPLVYHLLDFLPLLEAVHA